MAAQIVTGLGFPGAGLIFVRRDPVRGQGRHASLAEHQMVDERLRRPGRLLDAGAPVQIPTGQPGTDLQRHDPAEQQAACRLLNARVRRRSSALSGPAAFARTSSKRSALIGASGSMVWASPRNVDTSP
jgi:plasmid replication initiation protein